MPTQTTHGFVGLVVQGARVNLSLELSGTSQQTTAFPPNPLNSLATNIQPAWKSQFREKETTHPLIHKHREES